MALAFPSSPTTNQTFTDGTRTWRWNGTAWQVVSAYVLTGDPRLSDSRTPSAHKSSHATGGADALAPADIGAEPAFTSLPIDKGGTGATTAEQARINLGITGGVTSYNQLTDKPTLGTAAATNASDYATAAQGAKADSALQPTALTPYRTSAAQDTLDANKVTNGGGASTISVMTQAAYNALAVKDNNTIYILT